MHSILIVGAALIGLPILLHLIMKQEPKKLLFPAIRFLQQRRKSNQRKLRLRHFLLLALRVLLIALFCLTLFQPVVSGNLQFVNLSGEQPVAVVMVIDTSPSMGYRQNNFSRLDEAKRRALELLEDLPPNSRVCILDSSDPSEVWEQSLADARKRIESISTPTGLSSPTSAVLPTAYSAFKKLDQDMGVSGGDALQRLVVVFSDRTAGSWEGRRVEELKKLRDLVPNPKPVQLFVDVGAESPTNVSILNAEIRPQLLTGATPALLMTTVQATGIDVASCQVTCTLDDSDKTERQEKALRAGSAQAFQFKFENLTPGFHRAVVRIRDDNLGIDNERYVTFAIAKTRKLLAIADDEWDAAFWQLAHRQHREFDCDIVTPAAVENFANYEAVCLINVSDPTRATKSGKPLHEALKAYVEGGGKLLIAPGDLKAAQVVAFNDALAKDLLPGKLDRVRDWSTEPAPKQPADPKEPRLKDRRFGVFWKVDTARDTTHPMLAPFNDWRLKGNVNVLRNPRPAVKYWLIEKHEAGVPVVYYDDDDLEEKRNPAVWERTVGKGTVLMLTTRIDPQDEEGNRWNEYWATTDSSWPVVFPNLVARYLAGSPEDAVYNFATGSEVRVPLPAAVPGKPRKLILEGTGVSGRDAFPEIPETETEYIFRRVRTQSAGTFILRNEDRSWEHRFSLNVPAEESTLDKVPEDSIEELFGPKSVIPLGKNLKLRDAISTVFDQPLDLFPWLLIGVLILFVVEGLFANRFYKTRVN